MRKKKKKPNQVTNKKTTSLTKIKSNEISDQKEVSLTKKYLSIRTPIIFILTIVMVLLFSHQTILSAFILAILTSVLSFLLTSFLSKSIDRALAGRLAFRKRTFDIQSYQADPSEIDNFIYAIDYVSTITFPVFACYFVSNYPSIKQTIEIAFFSFAFQTFLFIVSFIYLGLLFFVFKKRIFIAFFILLLSVPLSGLLDFYGDAMNISKKVQNGFFFYATGMTCYLGLVGALDYLDKGIQKKEGKIKMAWNKLVGFIAWDFLDKFKDRSNND
jgi:hypothetical protein